jgi:hypothetical protein
MSQTKNLHKQVAAVSAQHITFTFTVKEKARPQICISRLPPFRSNVSSLQPKKESGQKLAEDHRRFGVTYHLHLHRQEEKPAEADYRRFGVTYHIHLHREEERQGGRTLISCFCLRLLVPC